MSNRVFSNELPRFATFRSVVALILREMSSTYGKSAGGYVWAIVQPIGIVFVLALGFSLLIKAPSLGTSFLLFYATGFLPYDMYNQVMRVVLASLTYSRTMLAYPRVVWLDAIIARFGLNALTQVTVFLICMTIILLIVQANTVISLAPIVLGVSMALMMGLGVGMMNCLLNGVFPVWNVIWKILTRPMFVASGVLFIYEDMPGVVQSILWWNPVIHATGLVRKGFYPSYHGSYISLTYGFGVCLLAIALGLLFLRRYNASILKR